MSGLLAERLVDGSGYYPALPSNFAFLQDDRSPANWPAGLNARDFELVWDFEIDGQQLFQLAEPFAEPLLDGERSVAGLDAMAPEQPEILGGEYSFTPEREGCAYSSCGDLGVLTIDLGAGADDQTPADVISFALFIGRSRDDALSASAKGLYLRDGGGSVWDFVGDLRDQDIWVSVAALDLAGNISERAEPVQVYAGQGGCAASNSIPHSTVPLVLVTFLLVARFSHKAGSPPSLIVEASAGVQQQSSTTEFDDRENQ